MPTEAEWEYAAGAGSGAAYGFGNEDSLLQDHGWYQANSGSVAHPVGERFVNAFGLFDMHGNVWEWVWDWYADYPTQPLSTDYVGPETGVFRGLRGGSFDYSARYARSARRVTFSPTVGSGDDGFRCARGPLAVTGP